MSSGSAKGKRLRAFGRDYGKRLTRRSRTQVFATNVRVRGGTSPGVEGDGAL